MRSSIIKSISAAAAFLAAPTVAQIGNWDIIYQSLETDFQDSVTNEITLDYRIGQGRTFNIDLFDKDCIQPITGMVIAHTTTRTDGVTEEHDQLEIMLDLDKSAITSSNIWSGIKLEFCVRVQLLSGIAVIREDNRDIDITFDFVVDFEASATTKTVSMTSGSGQANVDSYISACKCDNLDSFTCDNTPLAPNTNLVICIQSMDFDVEISFLSYLQLFQGNALGNETLVVVDGLTIQNEDISVMRVKNATAVGVETVVPSSFFSYNGVSTATVFGIVQVNLVGPSRGLRGLALDYDAIPVTKSNVRVMRGKSSASVADASPFEITIGMERQAVGFPLVNPNYPDSGTPRVDVYLRTRVLGVAVSFAWILL